MVEKKFMVAKCIEFQHPPPDDATDHESGEDVDVIDSDLEEGDSIFECLNDYCF